MKNWWRGRRGWVAVGAAVREDPDGGGRALLVADWPRELGWRIPPSKGKWPLLSLSLSLSPPIDDQSANRPL